METARMVARARRHGLHLPRGDADPQRLAGDPEARRRPAGAADRRPGPPGRGARHRARPPRLADPAAQGAGPARPGDDLPPRRAPLAGAGRDRDGADLAQRRAAVGGPRRPAADAPRGGDRRRQLGHRGRGAARPRRASRSSSGPAPPSRRREIVEAEREPALPGGRRAARLAAGQAGLGDRAGRPRPDLPRDPLGLAAAGGRRDRRPGRRALRDPAAHQGPGRARRASFPPSTSASGCAPGRSPASAAPPTRARRSPARPPWCSAPPTPTCAASSARSSTAPGSSASAPTTSSGSRWRARRRTPPRSPPPPPSRTASTPPGSPPPRSGASASSTRSAAARKLETFSGLAGVGDLTATVMAPDGRNRRAGELLGAGTPADADPAADRPGIRGPRHRAADGADGRRAPGSTPGLDGLAALIRGETRRRGLGRGPAPGRALAGGRPDADADRAREPG